MFLVIKKFIVKLFREYVNVIKNFFIIEGIILGIIMLVNNCDLLVFKFFVVFNMLLFILYNWGKMMIIIIGI